MKHVEITGMDFLHDQDGQIQIKLELGKDGFGTNITRAIFSILDRKLWLTSDMGNESGFGEA